MNTPERMPAELDTIVAEFDYPLVFATVSGAHLYGFPSPDSDFDLRGCHVLPASDLLGLKEPKLTEERLGPEGDLELDLVSHDLGKFANMLLRKNGYVLEQLLSPIVIHTTDLHAELIELVPGLVTRNHAHHYLGFAKNQWKLFESTQMIKKLLYVYRVLFTGIHLVRTGEVEANLVNLLQEYDCPGVDELIAIKRAGAETQRLDGADLAHHQTTYSKLVERLEQERDRSPLPEVPTGHEQLDRLVRERRLATI